MNHTEVEKSLTRHFARELPQGAKRHIIFWYDAKGEFAEAVDGLSLGDVKTIKLYDNNMFAVKLYIEDTDRESNLLVYSPLPRPDDHDNWLTDILQYSQTFSTDMVSLIMLNDKIDNALRGVVEKHKDFWGSTERANRFANYALAPYSEHKIELGILSALCKLSAPNIDNAVRTLLVEMIDGNNAIYESIGKFGNIDTFWNLVNKTYGYKFPEQSLEKLAVLLLCGHLSHSLDDKMPKEWQAYVSGNPNCFVFVDNFMRNSQYWDNYNALAAFVADKLGLSGKASEWTIDEIVNCDAFEDFDRIIIKRITENINQNAGEYEYYRRTINSRKNRRYYPQFETEYAVLTHACEYLELIIRHKELPGADIAEMLNNYVKEYHKTDMAYRHFMAAYDRLVDDGDFTALYEKIENNYTNRFLDDLAMKWCALWDDETKWHLPGVTSQQGFYNRFVSGFVRDNERVVVIISDGLRYESAVELNALINREHKGTSTLREMLGVIPSTTSLGMAALLPHKEIAVTDKGAFEIGGISTEGTENRGKILSLVKKESIAVQYDDIAKLNGKQLLEKLAGMKLIYIYHNTIDARGDNAGTEHEVFEATERAFKELSSLVGKLRNSVGVINIIITADHGYIYRQTKLQEYDKTPKQDLAGIQSGRRYILAKEEPDKQGTQTFPMNYLNKNRADMYAIIPRSTNCFKLQGAGSRYVHGGTSPQEVVIPVIAFKSDKNEKRSKEAAKISLGLLNLSRKITSVITNLNFHQAEPVDDKHLPLRVAVYFEDEAGNRISNENIIIADSTDKQAERRVYKEKFTLKNMAYNKGASYYLVMKDEEEMVNQEIERIPFAIDLVFGGTIQF